MCKQLPTTSVWRIIRLELAPSPEFSEGSASRAYMLCLPLCEDGAIDEEAFKANQAKAICRRFWPNEPDRTGFVVRARNSWALSFHPAASDGDATIAIELVRLLPGDHVTVGRSGHGRGRFRVVDLRSKPAAVS